MVHRGFFGGGSAGSGGVWAEFLELRDGFQDNGTQTSR